jgi:ATP-dependent RNA helicase DDX55/SPB4
MRPQTGAHVLVGTPGRLDDIMARAAGLSVKRLELLVLDEADRLLSMGFAAQVGSILRRLPKQRRTGLFSATQTEEVAELARAGLRNPVRITVRDASGGEAGGAAGGGSGKTPSQLALYFTLLEADAKLPRLVAFLARHAAQKARLYSRSYVLLLCSVLTLLFLYRS